MNEIYCLSKLIWKLCVVNKYSMSVNCISQEDCYPCNLTLWMERFVKTLQLPGKLILEKKKRSYWILSSPPHEIIPRGNCQLLNRFLKEMALVSVEYSSVWIQFLLLDDFCVLKNHRISQELCRNSLPVSLQLNVHMVAVNFSFRFKEKNLCRV